MITVCAAKNTAWNNVISPNFLVWKTFQQNSPHTGTNRLGQFAMQMTSFHMIWVSTKRCFFFPGRGVRKWYNCIIIKYLQISRYRQISQLSVIGYFQTYILTDYDDDVNGKIVSGFANGSSVWLLCVPSGFELIKDFKVEISTFSTNMKTLVLMEVQRSKMELFSKTVDGWKPLIIFIKNTIFDVSLIFEQFSAVFNSSFKKNCK